MSLRVVNTEVWTEKGLHENLNKDMNPLNKLLGFKVGHGVLPRVFGKKLSRLGFGIIQAPIASYVTKYLFLFACVNVDLLAFDHQVENKLRTNV